MKGLMLLGLGLVGVGAASLLSGEKIKEEVAKIRGRGAGGLGQITGGLGQIVSRGGATIKMVSEKVPSGLTPSMIEQIKAIPSRVVSAPEPKPQQRAFYSPTAEPTILEKAYSGITEGKRLVIPEPSLFGTSVFGTWGVGQVTQYLNITGVW